MKKLYKQKSIFPIEPLFILVFIFVVAFVLNIDKIMPGKKTVQNPLESDAYVQFIKNQNGLFDKNAKIAIFNNKKISLPKEVPTLQAQVLGDEAPNDNKWIEINLTEQRLYLHEGNNVVGNFLVSTGLYGRTPTGTYRTYVKYRYTKMSGGSGASYYYLPNVPFTMYFYKGYGIHGTYWHNNFGHPMSHGCINMRTSEAEIAYNFAPVGTKVVIHY